MSKDDSSSDKEASTDIQLSDPDPVQLGETPDEDRATAATADEVASTAAEPPPPKTRRSWFGWFNFLLILVLAGAGFYYWWLQQQVARDYESAIAALEQALATRIDASRLESGLRPLQSEIGALDQKLQALELGQQGLQTSSEKLYELYGRDKNDWQLAEVEYLMRVAQHKLILQDDFAGAAITLQAASDKIGLTGDPGLLPVRVLISEEIADLRTRKRADLVGMTLTLAQLGRQVRSLQPGFALRVDEAGDTSPPAEPSGGWLDSVNAYIDSLVTIRNEASQPSEIEANSADVSERLEDNLKLARWAVLERVNRQYRQLIEQSLRLFREFYDLDNAANSDFLSQLQDLEKMVLKPEKPDIGTSLRELQRILSQRENAPPVTTSSPEADNG